MSAFPSEVMENRRICLVGVVLDNEATVKAAQTFGLPVITSETGSEYILDDDWITYFVLNRFEGPMFEAIHKSKHRILGPPALKELSLAKDVLPNSNRPVYNYSMRGVITCFTGIRKKEELTHLVNLIHAMGGKIRKDMNSKITHLICNNSGGEKYQYAMTFRLTVVRSEWVLDAWKRRDELNFNANEEEFFKMHQTKAFEGQRVCFFGFSTEEHQHMVDVLVANGGVPTNLEDPDCTHVVMSNTGDHFPENLNPSPDKSVLEPPQIRIETKDSEGPLRTSSPVEMRDERDKCQANQAGNDLAEKISPIVCKQNPEDSTIQSKILQPINEEEESAMKRKRESPDNVSLTSIDSMAPSVILSAKKPKLTRTGSISRTLKRSMSFITPIANVFRPNRTSVDPNTSISSIASVDLTTTTLNESMRRPMKEVFRGMKERITRSSKKDFVQTPKSSKNSARFGNRRQEECQDVDETLSSSVVTNVTLLECEEPTTMTSCGGFKTPIAPSRSHQSTIIGRHSVCGTPTDFPSTSRFSDINNAQNLPYQAGLSVAPSSTLPIVDEHAVHTKLDVKNSKTHILKADWFWYTIQNGFADEQDYKFDDYLDSIANTPCSDRRDSLPVTFNKRKRKRLSRTIKEELTPLGLGKRRSSVSDAGLLTVSGSFLECTASPDKNDVSKVIPESETSTDVAPPSSKKQSMRYNHFLDFWQTESNYVGILDTIVKLFKEPLEIDADTNANDALLNKSEIRAIFSNFLPIYDVHRQMFNSIKELQACWTEDCLIGKIILDHRDDLIKAYPPYVNFFEQMKESLVLCDNQKPRFHAFLKINQAKPECGRQSLQDLMIRPVQRLPSISLLINDILKHTPKSNPDAKKLEEALRAIKEVMTYINEDKRKTEGQLAMFDIFNDIDNCPPDLVSAQRSLVSKCEVTELSDQLSGRGDSLMLCLFTDNIEVCKKRSRGLNHGKSPTTTMNGINLTTKVKSYKHIKLIPLSSIRYVVDIRDSPRAFALSCRLSKENKDKEYYFSINEEKVDKTMYLRSLCKQMAENSCRADADQFLASVDSTELSIDISDLNVGTLSKAFKFATRTRLKVGRAFSFNKTPSKLKRAVSTMMTNSLTPASQLAQMKLASCNNINEIGEEDKVSKKETLIAPMSVQPTRKANAIMAGLRRI
ncbi:ECT2 [Sergentomyia squamirostris]